MPRVLVRVALVLTLLGALAARAAADTPVAGVTVYSPGSSAGTVLGPVSVETLQARACPTYSPGSSDTPMNGQSFTLPPDTWTLATVLTCGLGVSLANGNTDQVQRGSGSWEAALTYPQDLTSPSSFSDPNTVPVIYFDGSSAGYYRPPRSAGDDNAADHVDGQPIAIEVDQGGPPLTVSITTAPAGHQVPAGTTIELSGGAVASSGAPISPSKLHFTWSLAGGATFSSHSASAAGPTAEAKLAAAGVYSFTLRVVDSDGSGGAATIAITVGSIPAGAAGRVGPRHRSRPRDRPGPIQTSIATVTIRSSPTLRTGAAPPSAAPETGGRPRHGNAPEARPVRRITRRSASGTLVDGRLIGAINPLAPGESPVSAGLSPVASRLESGSPVSGVGAGIAVALLFGLGAARELRGRRRGLVAPT